MSQQDIWTGTSGNWTTAADWTNDQDGTHALPTSTQDAFIGFFNTGTPLVTTNVTVNSIGTNAFSTLTIGQTGVANVTFTATNGTVLSGTDTSAIASGNLHDINVAVGSTLVIGSTFDNQGTLIVGLGASRSSSGTANLKLVNLVTLNGGGTVDLGEPDTNQGGNIVKNGSSDGLTNVNNTIVGSGSIALAKFDNESGNVIAQGTEGAKLQVYATSNWTNSGTYTATSRNFLDLGKDGTTTTLINTGSINLDGQSTLQIAGTLELTGLTGVGAIVFKGADAAITSDGQAATLINHQSTIEANIFGGTIGDSHLTLINESNGLIAINGPGQLTLNTGSNTITNAFGATLEAANGGNLIIESPVDMSGSISAGGGGTIKATSNGTVTIDASVGALAVGTGIDPGQVLISGGTVSVGTGGFVFTPTPIKFSGAGGILQVTNNAGPGGQIAGFAAGDFLDLTALSFGPLSLLNWVENGGGTAGTLAVSGAVNGGSSTVTLSIDGSFSNASFRMFNDGHGGTEIGVLLNPAPPAGTTADMILRHGADGLYEIYDLGNNAILAAYQLGQVDTDWQVAGLGGFDGSDTTDMLLRSASTGGFEVYDISNNNITNAAFMGTVGLNWQVMGFGNFSSMPGETDMILRDSNTGGFQVYDIKNNAITSSAFMGTVGLDWQFSGVGNFSGPGESDMLLRSASTGGLEVYDIANNTITNAAFMGTVGLDWQFSGVGNFSGVPGETDLLLRNSKTGGLELYDINNNQITGAAFIGTVGLDWQFAGVAAANGAGTSDLVLRSASTGAFEVYDIANNQLTGAASLGSVGLDWQLGGFAVDPPTPSMGSSDGSTSQLVQAMAGFGGGSGAGESLTTAPLSAETSQQPLLTIPQHS